MLKMHQFTVANKLKVTPQRVNCILPHSYLFTINDSRGKVFLVAKTNNHQGNFRSKVNGRWEKVKDIIYKSMLQICPQNVRNL